MFDPIETIDYKSCTIEIYMDDDADDPRNWDNLGHMTCFHNRYSLGDSHNYNNLVELSETINDKNSIILPLYLYDHSGITINTTGFSCPWDSGQVGIIYMTKEEIRKEYNWKVITKNRREKIYEYLINEVKIYDDFLTGNVYGFMTKDKCGDDIESCWGFFGETDYMINEAKGEVDYYLDQKRKEHFKQVKTWIKNSVPLYARKVIEI